MSDQDGYSGTWALDMGIGILEGLAAFGEVLLSASPVGWVVAAFVGTLSQLCIHIHWEMIQGILVIVLLLASLTLARLLNPK